MSCHVHAFEQVVEVDESETTNPALRGEMTITITLADADGGGTDLVAFHDGMPAGVSLVDNERGWADGTRQTSSARRGLTNKRLVIHNRFPSGLYAAARLV
jgi:hypothetical protein